MRLLRLLVIVLVGLWLVVEVVAIPVAGRLVESQVAARARGATSVHASVGSFPVVARVVFTGRVNSVDVTLENVAGQRVPFTEIRFDVSGAAVDRASLATGKVKVTKIDTGSVMGTIDLSAAAPVVGRIASHVSVSGHTLLLNSIPVQLNPQHFPCSPDAHIDGQQVIVSCTFTNVPPVLLEGVRV